MLPVINTECEMRHYEIKIISISQLKFVATRLTFLIV